MDAIRITLEDLWLTNSPSNVIINSVFHSKTVAIQAIVPAQTVPIYWGDPVIAETFNEESFINCNNYSSWDEVLEVVKRIDSNPELYAQMLSVPALKHPEVDTIEAKLSQLSDFLCHIFGQELTFVMRYNRVYWGHRYVKRMRQHAKASRNSFRGIAERLYMKYFWKHRRKGILWKLDRLIKKFA